MSDKGEFFKGASVKPVGKGPISVKGIVSPKKKENKTTDGKDVTAGISRNQPSLGDGVVKPACDPTKNVCVDKPTEKLNKESVDSMFKFDRIWRELTEAEDAIGGDLDAPNSNIEGDSFDDDAGDFESIDDETGDDTDTDEIGEEDAASVLRRIRDEINDFLGETEDDEESDLLDDTDSELEDEDLGDEDVPPAPPAATPAPPPPGQPGPQVESWQHKTKFGPKMSDKAPGRLGKRKGSGKPGKGSLKKGVTAQDAKGKKVPLSKFNPKMSDKVSRLKKGELF